MGETELELAVKPEFEIPVKRFYILKTNGVANIRTINMSLPGASHTIRDANFWMPGYMVPRKLRNSAVLRKQFLFYDYAIVQLSDPLVFKEFLQERKIPAYLLQSPGDRGKGVPEPLTDEEILRIKQLEAFKQLEAENFEAPKLKVGTVIEVCNGSFIGCKGTILEIRTNYAILEMNVFGRPTRVNVNLEFLSGVLRSYEPEEVALPTDDL